MNQLKGLLIFYWDTKYLGEQTKKSSREQKKSVTARLKCRAGAQLTSFFNEDKTM